MVTFRTKSGSLYEVDEENKRVRRTKAIPGHPDKSIGWGWRPYHCMSPVNEGLTVTFVLCPDDLYYTRTSLVVEVVG